MFIIDHDVALRLLNGAPPRSIRVRPLPPGQPTFDWRELQRWGIAESRLPTGSVVMYRTPGLWREYRFTVLSAAGAMVVQSLLIGGLLYLRRARRRAELDSRKNLALAADANYRLISLDAGLTYKGPFLQTEFYFRNLDGLIADGPLPVSEIKDHGFYVQGAFYPIKKKLQVYSATSQIFGDKGASTTARSISWDSTTTPSTLAITASTCS